LVKAPASFLGCWGEVH